MPFGDRKNGLTTYGAGRYMLDTIKDADLCMEEERPGPRLPLRLQPVLRLRPRWVCPLPRPPDRLPFPVAAGERML